MDKTIQIQQARFEIGHLVKHRLFPFRGVVFDVDPQFSNTEEWYQAIPAEIRPAKNQPFYRLFAVGPTGPYEAYVSEQNLLDDTPNGPIDHPDLTSLFAGYVNGRYRLKEGTAN